MKFTQNLHIIAKKLAGSQLAQITRTFGGLKENPQMRWARWFFMDEIHTYTLKQLLSDYEELQKTETFAVACAELNLTHESEQAILRFTLELAQLTLLIAVTNHLPDSQPASVTSETATPFWIPYLKKSLFWLLVPIGITISLFQGMDAIASILELAGITFSLSAWPVLVLVILGAFCSCALYYAFEIECLKEKLGTSHKEELKNHLEIHAEHINTLKTFEKKLCAAPHILDDLTDFRDSLAFYHQAQSTVQHINNILNYYQESSIKKFLKRSLLSAGTFLTIGDTLYTITGMIGKATLLGHPLGIVFLFILASGAAIFFTVSYTNIIYETLNPTAGLINQVKNEAMNYCRDCRHQTLALQKKLSDRCLAKKLQENHFKLTRELKQKTDQLTLEQEVREETQKECELWKLWRAAKYPGPVSTSGISPSASAKARPALTRSRSHSCSLSTFFAAPKTILHNKKPRHESGVFLYKTTNGE
jgi:hypothetical protein